jgi:pimeloyl-ACP methyl ester carboxylesterase
VTRKRPKGVLAITMACIEGVARGRTEHMPAAAPEYPESVVRRASFEAGGGQGWRIAALETPRETPAPWKIVVITGAPSWGIYWADTLAQLPQDREMIVVDRPGYGASEPLEPVTDIRVQAEALAPVLKAARGQKVMLVGQSYGAAIASLMAEAHPDKVASLVLLSGFFGEPGPTSRWLIDMGSKALKMLPRDLRHAVIEVSGQKPQLAAAKRALARLRIPIHMIHGDQDDFAPIEVAERLAAETMTRQPIHFVRTPGANHFLNDGPVEQLLAALEACIPVRKPWTFPWPAFGLKLPRLPGFSAPRQMAGV